MTPARPGTVTNQSLRRACGRGGVIWVVVGLPLIVTHTHRAASARSTVAQEQTQSAGSGAPTVCTGHDPGEFCFKIGLADRSNAAILLTDTFDPEPLTSAVRRGVGRDN